MGIVLTGYGGDLFGGYKEVFYLFSACLLVGTLLVLLIKIPDNDPTASRPQPS